MLALVLLSASWIWGKVLPAMSQPQWGSPQASSLPGNIGAYMTGGAIVGFILAMVTIFKKQWSGVTAPLYALCQGLFLGGISAVFEAQYPGIVMQAVALTFGTAFCMFLVYKSGLVKVNQKFIMGIAAATGAIFLVYMVSFIVSFFGRGLPFIQSAGPIGIGFSLLVCGIAALNLILDFWVIEQGARQGAPKYMEWYGAFALMVTLIWLYLEILRLLSKMNRR
ncbi:MAG: Bax inhibitor-1/YccA family protein [Candidatus Omnitrophota bacterium]